MFWDTNGAIFCVNIPTKQFFGGYTNGAYANALYVYTIDIKMPSDILNEAS
jgi:hypothetical protein